MSRMKSWQEITAPLAQQDRVEVSAFVVSVAIIAFVAGLFTGMIITCIWSVLA